MDSFIKFKLNLCNGQCLYYNQKFILPYQEELEQFLSDQNEMNTILFAKKMMLQQEIKSNNVIDGVENNLSSIEEIMRYKKIPPREKQRIITLYQGYQYISNRYSINQHNLDEVYTILSNGCTLLNSDVGNHNYRKKQVYMLRGSRLVDNYSEGIDCHQIEFYMQELFHYIDEDDQAKSSIHYFLKSQVIHFYFVYIHPYLDVNGRTGRTLAMWYMLNHEIYPYVLFNRAIAFTKRPYEKMIMNTINSGNMTLFFKYLLVELKKELEKEYIINNIIDSIGSNLTPELSQIISYFLTMNGNLTMKDLAQTYNNYNSHQRAKIIVKEKIVPLMEQKILLDIGTTKGYIQDGLQNRRIALNREIIDIDSSKIKYLKLERFLNPKQ